MAGVPQAVVTAEGTRLSQLVANQLRATWNPQGWQTELTLQERVQTIIEM